MNDDKEHIDKKKPIGFFRGLLRAFRSVRFRELIAICFTLLIVVVELFWHAISSEQYSLAFAVCVFFICTVLLLALTGSIYLDQSARTRDYLRVVNELSKMERERDHAVAALKKRQDAENSVAKFFADLGRAEAEFQTAMLGSMSPEHAVFFDGQANAK